MDINNADKNEILKKIKESSKKTDQSIANLAKNTDDSVKRIDQSIANLSEKTEEILEAIGHFSNKTDERFNEIESKMVTKDYLDEKLSDMKGDLTILMRKEDRKLLKLVNILETRKVISSEDANMIMMLEPFPQSR